MKVHTASYLSLAEVAKELGVSKGVAVRTLTKLRWVLPPVTIGGSTRYDARVIDLLHALRGQEHRTLDPVHADWLAVYQKEHS